MKIGDNIRLETNKISIKAENITIKSPEYKIKLNFGGVDIFFTKKFNWFKGINTIKEIEKLEKGE